MGTKTNMMVFNFRCVKGIDFSRLVELGLLNVEGDDGVSFTWKHPEQTGTDLSLFQRNGVTSLFEVIYIYILFQDKDHAAATRSSTSITKGDYPERQKPCKE